MTSSIYFLIAGRDELIRRLNRGDSDMVELLSEKRLWSAKISDRSDWSVEAATVATKILFQLHLRNEYSDSVEYVNAIGGVEISESLFDELWSIVPLQVDERFEDVESHLSPSALIGILPTGIPIVDAWIDRLSAR